MKSIKLLAVLLVLAASVQAQSYRRVKQSVLTSGETFFFPATPATPLSYRVPFEGNNGFMGYTFFAGEGFLGRLPFRDPLSVANMVSGVQFDRQVTVLDPGNIYNIISVMPGSMKLPDSYYAPLGPVVDKK